MEIQINFEFLILYSEDLVNNETLDSIFITFSKNAYPFYSKIPHQIFAKLYTQLKIYLNDKNQLKNLLKHTIRVKSAIRPWC